MSIFDLAVIFFAWFIGGFINGVTGMGIAIVALPVFITVMDIKYAILASNILVFIISVYMGIACWKRGDFQVARHMFIASLPGIIIGTYLLYIVPDSILKICISIILIPYALWQAIQKKYVCSVSLRNSSIAGFTSGFFAASTSFSGPPVASYMLLLRWDKEKACSTMCLYFLIMTSITCAIQTMSGFYGDTMIWKGVMLGLPGAVLGIFLGNHYRSNFSETFFRKVLLFLIVIASIGSLYIAFDTMA